MEKKVTTGEKIRHLRLERNLTQKALASKCGMYESQIRKYETGKANPKIETLQKIADALNVPINELRSDIAVIVDNFINSIDSVFIEADVLEYNRIIDKQKKGDGFTPYEKRFISDYIDKSPLVREWFIENGLKSKEQNLERIQSAYEYLNNEGRKEAAKRIEELAKIECYTKPKECFKGKPTKEEINKAITAYLNDEPPQE